MNYSCFNCRCHSLCLLLQIDFHSFSPCSLRPSPALLSCQELHFQRVSCGFHWMVGPWDPSLFPIPAVFSLSLIPCLLEFLLLLSSAPWQCCWRPGLAARFFQPLPSAGHPTSHEQRAAGLGAEVTLLTSREAGAQLSSRWDPGWGWQSAAGVRPTMGPWAPSSECWWVCSGDHRSSPGSLSARSFSLSGRGSCSDWAWFVDVRTSALWSAACSPGCVNLEVVAAVWTAAWRGHWDP